MYPREKATNLLLGLTTDQILVFSQKTKENDKVRLVKEGSAMINLLDEKDKKDWYGIFNHVLLVTRYATHLACELEKKGVPIDPQLVLESALVSHIGRRQWDEAQWYKDALTNVVGEREAYIRKNISSELLSVRLLDKDIKKNNDNDIVKIREYVNDLWLYEDIFNAMITLYADCCTSQQFETISKRISRLIFNELTPDKLKDKETESTIVNNYVNTVITNNLSIKAALEEAKKHGINEKGDRLTLDTILQMTLISVDVEKKITDYGINTDPSKIPEPLYEKDFRKQYKNFTQ